MASPQRDDAADRRVRAGHSSGTQQSISVLALIERPVGFLYLLLRLEDFALLAGSIGLFLVLAWVMFITRRMNWYELRLEGNGRMQNATS